MADLSNAFWSETDASNNNASPNGWPEGMMPSGVNDAARADKGALKRFWDRVNPQVGINPVGGVWTFTTSNPSYPTGYVNGEIYSFIATAISAAGDQFRVNALVAKPIWVIRNYAFDPIKSYDIIGNMRPILVYDSSLASGAGAFLLLNPMSPVANTSGGAAATAGALTVNGALTATSATLTGTGISLVTAGGITATGLTINGAANINGNLQIPDSLSGTGALKIGSLGSYLGRQASDGSTILQTAQGYLLLNPGGSNVGIGTTSPTSTLHVVGTGTISGALSAGAITISGGGTALNLSGGSLNVAGSVSVGGAITAPSGTLTSLTLNGGGNAVLSVPNGAITTGGHIINGNLVASGSGAFNYGSGTALTVVGSGNACISCTNGGMTAGTYVSLGGVVLKPGGGMWTDPSDIRTKESASIADYTTSLAALMQLRPITYRKNGRGGTRKDGKTYIGLVADDVLPVMPEMVGTIEERLDPDDAETTDILTLDATALIYCLVNSVNELAAEVAVLKKG